MIDIRLSQVKVETEVKGLHSKVISIDKKLDNHKDQIWPMVNAHEKYINTQTGMSMGRMQFWGIVVTIGLIIVAILGLYMKTGE